MKRSGRLFATAIAVSIGMLATESTLYAQVSPRPGRIVGVWDVEATITTCDTGVPISSFTALHKYELGGTGQVVPAGNPTGLSAHMMIWNHVGGNEYRMTFKMFRYDLAGNYVGWVVVDNEVSINAAADEYIGSGVAEFFDTAGNFLFSSCPEFIGTRFTGE